LQASQQVTPTVSQQESLVPPADLLTAAQSVLANAYAPYSQFPVAAALRFAGGHIVTGTNVENACYGLGMCAERTAAFHAGSEGHRLLLECLVLTPTPVATTPCGACRQVLREFAPIPADLVIWSVWNGGARHWTLAELLPESFGPANLENARKA